MQYTLSILQILPTKSFDLKQVLERMLFEDDLVFPKMTSLVISSMFSRLDILFDLVFKASKIL
jgi:hypothetical protein